MKKRTCKNGHEHTKESTYINKTGYIQCKICRRNSDNKRHAKERARRYADKCFEFKKSWNRS